MQNNSEFHGNGFGSTFYSLASFLLSFTHPTRVHLTFTWGHWLCVHKGWGQLALLLVSSNCDACHFTLKCMTCRDFHEGTVAWNLFAFWHVWRRNESIYSPCVFAVCRLCVGLPAMSYKIWQTQTTLSASGIVAYVASYCSKRIEKQSLNTVTGIQCSTTWIYAFSLRSNLWCVYYAVWNLFCCVHIQALLSYMEYVSMRRL